MMLERKKNSANFSFNRKWHSSTKRSTLIIAFYVIIQNNRRCNVRVPNGLNLYGDCYASHVILPLPIIMNANISAIVTVEGLCHTDKSEWWFPMNAKPRKMLPFPMTGNCREHSNFSSSTLYYYAIDDQNEQWNDLIFSNRYCAHFQTTKHKLFIQYTGTLSSAKDIRIFGLLYQRIAR